MLLVGPPIGNGLKGGEVGIWCPLVTLDFSCVAIEDVFVYNGFLCVMDGVRGHFTILSGLESSKVVSPLSPIRSSSNRHHKGCSSRSSNISLRSPSKIGFEESFLVPVARLVAS
eukprot:Gb_41204 [translate_table: standard]